MKVERGYARNGDVNIAYAVAGDGPDFVYVPGFVSHLDLAWESPFIRPYFERLASFSRLITFDKRGTGSSDRHSIDTTIDVRMEDVRAVMDAAGSTQAIVAGQSEGGPMAMVFAATHPDQVSSLILIGSAARWSEAPDYPAGAALARNIAIGVREAERGWGEGRMIASMAPSLGSTPEVLELMGRIERATASPAAVKAIMDWVGSIDVRPALPAITVPTLILHRTGDVVIPDAAAHYLRDHIRNAKYVEHPGPDHIPWVGAMAELLDEIEEFVTGTKPGGSADRILATVLFTDIVDSTRVASELGDRRWREILEQHDSIAQREIQRYRGRMVKHTGDGLFATFEGPARGVQAATTLISALRPLGIQIRAGLHTGEVEVRGDDLGGIGVHIGARVAGAAGPSEVLVSNTVKDLVVGSGLAFEDRGPHTLKGVPGEWRLFAVAN